MSEYKWNADAFDAVRIVAANGEFEIVGAGTNEILLEGDDDRRHRFGSEPSIVGRWLMLRPFAGDTEWTLTLPRSKKWVVDVSSGNGEVEIENLEARINVQLGHGEIRLENCRGVFNVRTGSGDVTMENCVQQDMPAAPEYVAPKQSQTPPPVPGGIPPIPPIPHIPPIGVKVRMGKGFRMGDPGDWEEYGAQWEEWGEHFGEQVSQWAENLSRNFNFDFKFGDDDETKQDGIHVRLGHGDIRMEQVDALLVTTHTAAGDVQIEQGRIAELDAETMRGEIQVEGILPTTAWNLATRHGDISLSLSGDAYVRIDAATRHGEIECDAPLVRVGRPGPGARHGGRMVGTIGEGQGEPVDIHLESQHGDIQISADRRASPYNGQPASAKPSAPRSDLAMARAELAQARSNLVPQEPSAPVPTAQPAAPASAVVPVTVTDLTEPAGALNPPQPKGVQVYDSQMAILQALQKGEITIAEAEMLLRSLKN